MSTRERQEGVAAVRPRAKAEAAAPEEPAALNLKSLKDKKIAQVDIDEDQLEKVFQADVAINGDIKDVLSGVLINLQERRAQRKNHTQARRTVKEAESHSAESDYAVFRSRFPLVERFFAALDTIKALPEAYRETLILRLVEGMTGPEIAQRTGLSPGSVRVNLHRGMKLLRDRLAPGHRSNTEETSHRSDTEETSHRRNTEETLGQRTAERTPRSTDQSSRTTDHGYDHD